MKRIFSIFLVLVLCIGLCVPAMAATTEKVDITYRAIKIVLNGSEIVPCDAAGKTVEPFILNSVGSTYLPLRAIGQALGLDVSWDGKTNTVTLTSGGSVKTGAEPAGTTVGKQNVDVTYRDIKVILDGTQLTLKNALGETVEPFILNSNSSVYLPLRVVGEAFGLEVKWESATNTVYLDEPAAPEATKPLAIKTQPQDLSLAENSTDYIFVEVEGGKEPYSYQWQYSKVLGYKNVPASISYLDGETTDKLEIYFCGDLASDGYVYRCAVTDANGDTVYSDTVSIEVLFALGILDQPVDAECAVGETAEFLVVAVGGTAPYTYQWMYKDDTCDWEKVNNNYCHSGADTDTLEVTPDNSYMTYHGVNHCAYYCIVTDADGNTVESDVVTIIEKLAPLAITKQPQAVTCAVGDTATFSVEVSGGKAPYTYQWQARGVSNDFKNLKNGDSATLSLTTTADMFNVMKVNSFISELRCVITDADGCEVISDAVKLTKAEPPLAIVSQPQDVSCTAGESASFSVEVSGGKAPCSYQWQSYNEKTSSWMDIKRNAEGMTTDTLSMEASVEINGYKFRCLITDALGKTVTSDTATLILKK